MIFGFIEVPMWDYLWGLSERQVDLLLIDQPLVVYSKDKTPRVGAKGKNGVRDIKPPSASAVLDAEAKWKAKYGDGSKPKINLNF